MRQDRVVAGVWLVLVLNCLGGAAEVAPGDPLIRGRVVDPTGKPVAGAMVQTVRRFDDPYPPITATTAGDGQFVLANSGRFATTTNNTGNPLLIASAVGFGCGWAAHKQGRAEVTIPLVAAGPPIEGRLVDPAGQPVAGVTVDVRGIWVPIRYNVMTETGTLAPYLTPRDPRTPQDASLQEFPFSGPSATTDASGRFVIPGLGPERVTVLVARSPTISTTRFTATTSATLTEPVDRRDGGGTIRWYPARCEVVVAPGRSVAGVVTAAAMGQPLADWRVTGARTPGRDPRYDEATTSTDAAGRYTLTGLRPDGDDWVLFNPPPGQPYLAAGFRVPVSDPARSPDAPVRVDHAAQRGIIVRGQVSDQRTGAPLVGYVVAGSMVEAPRTGRELMAELMARKAPNPRLTPFPGHADSRAEPCFTTADGRYEVVLPPGPAVVAFRSKVDGEFMRGQGAEAIPGRINLGMTRYDQDQFPAAGGSIYPGQFHVLAAVDPPAGSPGLTLDLKVDSWRTVALNVVGPDGQPVDGDLLVDGVGWWGNWLPSRGERIPIPIRYLQAGSSRRVTAIQQYRRLAGSMLVEADGPGAQTLQLSRWGEVQGRMIGDDRKPRSDLAIVDDIYQQPAPSETEPVGRLSFLNRPLGTLPPPPGEFHLVGLVPGFRYRLFVRRKTDNWPIGELEADTTTQPGEIKDLGDLKVRPLPPRPVQPQGKP